MKDRAQQPTAAGGDSAFPHTHPTTMTMTNASKRANARRRTKADHPDAEIFALAEQVEAARKLHYEAMDALETAEDHCRHLEDPPVIIRTENDMRLGLFVGNRVGTAYSREDVPALRALARAHSVLGNGADGKVWLRATAILDALRDLNKEDMREGWTAGLVRAREGCRVAGDAYEEIGGRLAKIQATTIEGVFAKARAMRPSLLGDDEESSEESFDAKLQKALNHFGPDGDACALSLARDLVHLAAESTEPAR
jgi:hypothetical protein